MSERRERGGVGSGRSLAETIMSIHHPAKGRSWICSTPFASLEVKRETEELATDAIAHEVMATSALFQFAGRPQLNPPASRQFNEATTTTTEGGASRHTYQWGRRAGGRWPNKVGLCRRQAHHSLDFPAPALLALHRRMPARENRCHIV